MSETLLLPKSSRASASSSTESNGRGLPPVNRDAGTPRARTRRRASTHTHSNRR